MLTQQQLDKVMEHGLSVLVQPHPDESKKGAVLITISKSGGDGLCWWTIDEYEVRVAKNMMGLGALLEDRLNAAIGSVT